MTYLENGPLDLRHEWTLFRHCLKAIVGSVLYMSHTEYVLYVESRILRIPSEERGCGMLLIEHTVICLFRWFAKMPKWQWRSGNADAMLGRRCLKIGHIWVTRLDLLENRIATKTTFWHFERNSCEKCSNWKGLTWLKRLLEVLYYSNFRFCLFCLAFCVCFSFYVWNVWFWISSSQAHPFFGQQVNYLNLVTIFVWALPKGLRVIRACQEAWRSSLKFEKKQW